MWSKLWSWKEIRAQTKILYLKTGRAKRSKFYIQHFWWLKVQKLFNLLICILLDYVAHKITKRNFEKYQFWRYDSCFSSFVSKLTSVWNKLNLLLKWWFKEAKNDFRICYGLKKWSKYHLNTIQTTFSENNNYYWSIWVKINFCHAWKCIISGVFHRGVFWHLWRKPAIIFLKWLFFQKSLVISWVT